MSALSRVYQLLRAHFGPLTGSEATHPWWPISGSDPPFEILVSAVLVQQTRWETVEAAVGRLLDAGLLSPPAMAVAAPEPLATLIRPVAFHSQKAPGLIAIAAHITMHYNGSTAAMLARPSSALRAELLALPRVGRETCDVIMLYGGGHPVFVVDEYTRRLFERVEPSVKPSTQNGKRYPTSLWRAPYETLRQTIESELSDLPPICADFHAQINEVCVRYCLTRPRCDGPPARRVYSRQAGREHYHERDDGCPLRTVCRYYQENGAKSGR